MASKKPLLVGYNSNDFEQKTNGQYLEYLKLGVCSTLDDIRVEKINNFEKLISDPMKTQTPIDELPVLPEVVLESIYEYRQ